MDEIIKIFVEDPLKGLLIAAITLLIYFIKKEAKSREKQIKDQAEAVNAIQKDYTEKATDLQEAMGKATKAINGDTLRVREELFNLRQEIIKEVESVKNHASELSRRTEALVHNLNMTTERFDDKFGRLIELKEKVDYSYGRVVHIEASVGEQAIALKKHKEQIAKIARILEAQRLRELDKEKK